MSKIGGAVFTNLSTDLYCCCIKPSVSGIYARTVIFSLGKHFFDNFDGARRLTRERESFAESLVGLQVAGFFLSDQIHSKQFRSHEINSNR